MRHWRWKAGLGLIVCICVNVWAQPQAPIEWGEARLLMQLPYGLNVYNGVFAHGDTIVLAGNWTYGNRELATACVSGDNGQTFSPWHVFLTPDSIDRSATFAVTSTGLYCCAAVQGRVRGLYRSIDLGQTWIAPSTSVPYMRIADTVGDTIWCVSRTLAGDSLRWTTDGGQTFSSAIGVLLGNADDIDDFSVSDSALCLTSYTEFPECPYSTEYVVCAARPEGPFLPTRLNPSMEMTMPAKVELSRDGVGFVNSCARYTTPFPGGGALFLTATRGHGHTWTASDTLEPLESGGEPMVTQNGGQWVAAWFDTLVSPPFAHWGAWFRFSANDGRSWYPARQAFGEDFSEGWLRPTDLTYGRVRVYESCNVWNGIFGTYYFQWEGQIQRDTLAPIISNAVALPEILPGDTTVSFSASAMDNDSLWQMTVVIKHPEQADSLVLPLTRQGGNEFAASWPVPEDTSLFLYSYRAEDMWEHVTSYPDTGWLSFVVEGSSAGEFIPHPSSFILSAYPNPFNPTTTLALHLPRAAETAIEIFDLTGKRLQMFAPTRLEAGEHQIRLNGAEWASGIYFVHVQAGEWSHTLKIALIR
jgi:hypothetical protein